MVETVCLALYYALNRYRSTQFDTASSIRSSGHSGRLNYAGGQWSSIHRVAVPVDAGLAVVSVHGDGGGRGRQDALEEELTTVVVAACHGGALGMLGLSVTPEIYLALKCFRTDTAGEWLKTGMLATVCDEVRRLTKGLATLTTYVRLLTCDIATHTIIT